MTLEEDLRSETLKWLRRIEKLRIRGKSEFVDNINAYIHDTDYFLRKNDLIRAFECIVWAWAWLEIGRNLGYLEVEDESV